MSVESELIDHILEQRRRKERGLSPVSPERETPEQRRRRLLYESATSTGPETTGDVMAESARGLRQAGGSFVGAVGEKLEQAGGLGQIPIPGTEFAPLKYPGMALSEAGENIGAMAESIRPERPIEGLPGAAIETLGRMPVDLATISGALRLSPLGGVAGRIATFGGLSALESAGIQQSRNEEVDFGQVVDDGIRGAFTGAAFEAVAPLNIIGRMAGLSGYGAVEPIIFSGEGDVAGEDIIQSMFLTGAMGAFPSHKSIDPATGRRLEPNKWFYLKFRAKKNGMPDPEGTVEEGLVKASQNLMTEKPLAESIRQIPELVKAVGDHGGFKKDLVRLVRDPSIRKLYKEIVGDQAFLTERQATEDATKAQLAKDRAGAETEKMLDSVLEEHWKPSTGTEVLSKEQAKALDPWIAKNVKERGQKEKLRRVTQRLANGEEVPPWEVEQVREELTKLKAPIGRDAPQRPPPPPPPPARQPPPQGPVPAAARQPTGKEMAEQLYAERGGKPKFSPEQQMLEDQSIKLARRKAGNDHRRVLKEGKGISEAEAASRETFAAEYDRMHPTLTEAGQTSREQFRAGLLSHFGVPDVVQSAARQKGTAGIGRAESTLEATDQVMTYVDAWVRKNSADTGTPMDLWYEMTSVGFKEGVAPAGTERRITQAIFDRNQGAQLTFEVPTPNELWKRGKRVILALKNPNLSTAVHELAHVFREDLMGADLAFVEKQLGVKNGNWKAKSDMVTGLKNPTHGETFAYMMERWFRTGKTRNKALMPIFEKASRWIRSLWGGAKERFPDEIPEKMAKFFDSKFATDEIVPGEKVKGDRFVFERRDPETGLHIDEYYNQKAQFLSAQEAKGNSYGSEPPASPYNGSAEVSKKAFKNGSELGKAMPRYFYERWAKPLIDRVAKISPALADRFRVVVDDYNKTYGSLSDEVFALYNLQSNMKKLRANYGAFRDLMRPNWAENKRWATTRFQLAADGIALKEPLNPREQNIVDLYSKIVEKTGKMAVEAGVMVPDRMTDAQLLDAAAYQRVVQEIGKKGVADGGYTPEQRAIVENYREIEKKFSQADIGRGYKVRSFVPVKDGKRMLRHMTQEAWHALELGNKSEAFNTWVEALAEMNGLSKDFTLRQMSILKDRAVSKRAAFEFIRHFENYPTHVRLANGSVVPILQTHPLAVADAVVKSTSARLGFIKEFGQEIAGGERMKAIEEAYTKAGGDPGLIQDTLRAVNGMPIEISTKITPKPGEVGYDTARGLNFMESVIKTLALTRSAIPNIPESIGNTLAMVGWKRYREAWMEIAKDRQGMILHTARMGSRTRDFIHAIHDPARLPESISQSIRDFVLRGVGAIPVNELNELHAAVAGKVFAEDMKAGRWSNYDKMTLEVMKFNPKQIREIVSGKAEPDLYQAVETRMAEVTQGSTSLPAQRSRLANSRTWRHLFFAENYAQMKLDRTNRVWDAYRSASEHARVTGDTAGLRDARKYAMRYFLGTTASGAGATLLRAFLVGGGVAAVSSLWSQTKEDPIITLVESFKYAAFGAAPEAWWRSVSDGNQRNLLQNLGETSLPASMGQEMWDLVWGHGKYRDRSVLEKATRLFQSRVPISTSVMTALGAMGLAAKDPSREAAISAYWRYRRQKIGLGEYSGVSQYQMEKEQRLFKRRMRRVYEAIRGDESDARVVELLGLALGEDHGPQSMRQSLRARKLLVGPFGGLEPDEEQLARRAELRRYIGDDAYRLLEEYDALIDEWAGRI